MCGITGVISRKDRVDHSLLKRMVATMEHRGPDSHGTDISVVGTTQIGLGHARLSIIDLSQAGHQPMHYKHWSIVFNGEIYNYEEIRKELEQAGHTGFAGHSDTEVILHAMEQWGMEAISRFIGMFAFALVDRQAQKFYLVRDRAGVKPLAYYKKDDLFLFGSELKSMMTHPRFERRIDRASLPPYFDYGYVPTPHTIFQHCKKLEPGHILELDLSTFKERLFPYWQVETYYKLPKYDLSYEEAKEQLHDLLISAFHYRMVSDVPVGVFLSGGYDSSAVTAILQRDSIQPLKTFTIGFEEGNNEAPFARIIAEYLGTDHLDYICTTKEGQDIIPTLPYYFDEPFADESAIPTILVSRLARSEVKVALSADAGDEVFVGYDSYPLLLRNNRMLNKIPAGMKGISKSLISGVELLVPRTQEGLKHKMYGVAKSLHADQIKQTALLFRHMRAMPRSIGSRLFPKGLEPYTTGYDDFSNGYSNELDQILAADYKMYLQNDILTKVDRATMSISLEGREPLLDHRILEFAARLPMEYKIDGGIRKKILKEIVHQYIPKEIMDRPKAGFSVPIYSWLRGDLSYLLEDYLNERALESSGVFNVPFVLDMVDRFKQRRLHYVPLIWRLLMFQVWYSKWMD